MQGGLDVLGTSDDARADIFIQGKYHEVFRVFKGFQQSLLVAS
jgi:hypothetical protein